MQLWALEKESVEGYCPCIGDIGLSGWESVRPAARKEISVTGGGE